MQILKRITAVILVFTFLLNTGAESVLADSFYEAVITGFEETEPIYLDYSSKPDVESILEELPDVMGVYLNEDSEVTEIPVSWEVLGDYEDCEDYYYEFDPVWDDTEYPIAENVEVPYAGVYTNAESSVGIRTASVSANETSAYDYLKEKIGLNTAAACGVLANLYAESAINPKNLQDSYESSLGYTDSSYTKAVDNGKYSRTKFGKDQAGYGLCQWTYYSRKYDIYDYAKDKDKSIGNLSMQLAFMKKELSSTQLSKLKKFENSAQGAYDAASYFCSSYEKPANTDSQCKKRGNLAKDTYWKRYKSDVDSMSDSSNEIKISDASKPGNMKKGSMFTIKGLISAEKPLTSVTVGVYNSSGTMKIGETVKPNTQTYDLLDLDEDIKFGDLAVGSYTYKVTAKTESDSATLVSKSFKILGIKISGATKPGDMAAGTSFNVKGKITSTEGNLKSVTAGVYKSGERQTGKTVKPNAATYDLAKIDNDIVFGKLKAGTYVYKVTAKTEESSKTLVKVTFQVKPKKAVLSSLTTVSGQKLKVTWKKDSAVTGHQIKYSLNKDFSSSKTVTVKGTSTVSKTLTSLKKGKKYYVKVRGYKTVDDTKYYGAWSSAKLSAAIK